MLSELLTATDLRDLTDRARRSDQQRWLAEHAIPFRADGERLIVSRYHVRAWLAGERITQSRAVDLSEVR